MPPTFEICYDIIRLTDCILLCLLIKITSRQGLTSLNITECGLETTEGLEGLTGLTALHLSSNRLQSLDGVRGMTRLRKLWANDNRIKSVRVKCK